jgi:hypothetical protein
MIKVTYTYSFDELSGKPKRFLESKTDCKILGYGVSMDTVTLSVLYETKFKLKPKQIKTV